MVIDATGWLECAFDKPDYYWVFKPYGGQPSRRELYQLERGYP